MSFHDYVGTSPFVCDTCKGKWKTYEELKIHTNTTLHKIEMARKQINRILTNLEDDLR